MLSSLASSSVLFQIYFLVVVIDVSCIALKCYKGSATSQQVSSLAPVTCVDPTTAATTVTTTQVPSNHTGLYNASNIEQRVVTHQTYCVIMKSSESTNSTVLRYRDDSVKFGCDTEGMCDSVQKLDSLQQVTVKSTEYLIFCCTKDSCNTPDRGHDLLPKQLVCNSGTRSSSASSRDQKPCAKKVSYCGSIFNDTADSAKVKDSAQDFCDDKNLCKTNNITDRCERVHLGYRSSACICCCNTSLCNSWTLDEAHSSGCLHMTHNKFHMPSRKDGKPGGVKGTVIGAVSGVILVLLLAVVVRIGVKKWRKKNNGILQLQYQQITADFVDDADDVRLVYA